MKKLLFNSLSYLFVLSLFLPLIVGCKSDDNPKAKGSLEIKCINPMGSAYLGSNAVTKAENPQLVGDVTETLNVTLKICIGDVWVSQDVVNENADPNKIKWIKLTDKTNNEIKRFENYVFPSKEIPEGTYRSMKFTLKKRNYRVCVLKSNPKVVYEFLETTGSWNDPCDPNDESWANANYIGANGNFKLEGNRFVMQSEGEKVNGFEIKSGKKAVITWRLGAGATETCTNYVNDLNGNRKFDCGVDKIDIDCPPSIKYMWDFVVEYK